VEALRVPAGSAKLVTKKRNRVAIPIPPSAGDSTAEMGAVELHASPTLA